MQILVAVLFYSKGHQSQLMLPYAVYLPSFQAVSHQIHTLFASLAIFQIQESYNSQRVAITKHAERGYKRYG